MGLDPVTGTLLAISAATTANSFVQQRKAQGAQEEASAVGQAQQEAKAARQRRMAARQARIRRAQIAQAAANTGVGGASGQVAGTSAASRGVSATSSNLLGDQIAATAINNQTQRAARKNLNASISGEIAQTAFSVGMNPQATGAIQDFFSSDSQPLVDIEGTNRLFSD